MPKRTDKRGVYSNVVSIPHEQIQGRVQQIIIAFAVMVLPMLVLSGVLLGLVFYYRVPPNQYVSDDLGREQGREQDYSDAYLVRFSAPKLVLVASWSSTISPILIGFAITLASYPTAKNLLTASDARDTAQLPTPFQLSLIISTISSGSFSSIWNWSIYTFGWRNKRQAQVKALKGLMTTLFMGMILSTLVLVTDTWLHFSTKSIIFTQVGPNLDQSGLGFAINPNCTGLGVAGKDYTACVAYKLLNGYVESGNEALKIFANVSDIMSVPIHTDGEDRYAYVANPQTTRLASLDYTVETYAIHSQCKPVTPQCTNKSMELGNNINYTCPFAFKGTVDTLDRTGNADVTMAFFTNSTGKESIASSRGSFKNPYYYAAMLLTGLNMGGSDALAEDPDVLGPLYDSGTLVAVFCNSTIYDVTYSSINGTIKNWNPTLSNDTTTELFQAGAELIRMGMPYLIQAVSVAGFSDSGQDIADQFALAYSRNALATTAMTFVPQDALVSQQREQIQVAMVPKIPLYALISANLLLVVLGCILTTVALIALRGNTGEVQARLSVHALVAKAFEERAVNPVKEAEDLFEEKHSRQGPRLEFVRTNKGGWTVGRHVPDPVPIPEPLQ